MHETLNMLLPLAGILLGAKAAAQLSHRFGLPAVFGELLLGLLLGPSLLGTEVSALVLPRILSVFSSNETFWPSARPESPARSTAEI